jgi:hypothetical protein
MCGVTIYIRATLKTQAIFESGERDLNRPAVTVFIQALHSTIVAGSNERVEFFYEDILNVVAHVKY